MNMSAIKRDRKRGLSSIARLLVVFVSWTCHSTTHITTTSSALAAISSLHRKSLLHSAPPKTTSTVRRNHAPSSSPLLSSSSSWHAKAENDQPHMVPRNANAAAIVSVVSTMAFIGMDIVVRKIFDGNHIAFPSSLGACGALLSVLLLMSNIQSLQRANHHLVSFLQPGAALLAKWLPVFFVPSLITLPLTGSIGSPLEIMKIFVVILVGFFFTLLSTSYSVLIVRYFQKSTVTNISSPTTTAITSNDTTNTKVVPPPKAFSDVVYQGLLLGMAGTGAGAILTKRVVLTKVFLLLTTLHHFVWGARLPQPFKQLVHPLVTCTALTWTTMAIFGKIVTDTTFRSLLQSYKTGATSLALFGPGDVLLFLLGPAVVSLAVSMYDKRALMRQNLTELGTAISVSTLGGLYGTALMVRLLNIASPYLRLSLLSRNITSPLAMAIATILGADISLAVSMVVITGLIGANFGSAILNVFGIRDAVARGLGIGAAAHGLGTAAFANEKDAFPFAAISMALTASAATVAVSIPFIRNSLLQLALGV